MHRFRELFSIIVFSVGALALVLPRGYSIAFLLACLIGLIHWARTKNKLFDEKNKWLIWPCLAYAVVDAAISLAHQWALRSLDPYVPFMLIVFGIASLRIFKPRIALFWVGLAVGAVGAACFAGYQALVLEMRSGGHLHPIQFGNIALLMGVLCLVRLLTVRGNKWLDVLMLTGFCAGLAASVWSQTRGGWVALLMICVWMMYIVTKGWHLGRRIGAVAALLGVLAIPVLQSNGVVQTRVMTAVNEASQYWSSNAQASSIGSRFAMWTYASKEILDAPLIGHGDKGWLRSRDAAIEKGELDPFIKDFSHLHNEYLDVAYKTGLIGLAFLLCLYLLPMLMFFKPYLNGYGPEARALAMGGIVLTTMYIDFGLTQTFLSHNSGRMVFVSLLMCLGALLLNVIEDK